MLIHNETFRDTVDTEAELRSIIGEPSKLATGKVISHLDKNCRDFIKQSPFLVLSTANQLGFCDASPRGDMPGFVLVLDEKRLIIPERPVIRELTQCVIFYLIQELAFSFLFQVWEKRYELTAKLV